MAGASVKKKEILSHLQGDVNEGVWSGLPWDRSCFSINMQMLNIPLPQQTRQGLLTGKMGVFTVVLGVVEKRGGCGRNTLFN